MLTQRLGGCRFVDECAVSLPKRGGGTATVRLAQSPVLPKEGQGDQQRNCEHEVAQATGCTVWDGALLLGRAIAALPLAALAHSVRPAPSEGWRPRCIEIGAGTGALGLSVGAAGALSSLLLTDMPAVLPLTAANLRANRAALAAADVRCATAPLLWSPEREAVLRQLRSGSEQLGGSAGQDDGRFDLVIGSDLLYREEEGDEAEDAGSSQQECLLGALHALLPAVRQPCRPQQRLPSVCSSNGCRLRVRTPWRCWRWWTTSRAPSPRSSSGSSGWA